MYTPDRSRDRVRDVVIALVVMVLTVGGTSFVGSRTGEGQLDLFGYVLLGVPALALVVRRDYPVPVLLGTTILAMAYPHAGPYPPGPFVLPMMVALFNAASLGLRRWAIGVAVVFFAVFLVAGAVRDTRAGESIPFVSGWLVSVLIAGEVARSQRKYVAEAQARASEAERTREEEARRRATEERLRIAREVHDVLSHSISMINVQAGVAAHLLDAQPEQARTALLAIKQASKDALRDLRATLGVLRDVDAVDGGARPAPAQGLALLDDLVSDARTAGVEFQVTTEGRPRTLPAGVDLAAYRIVQQSVSNVVRHAGRTTGSIAVCYSDDDLTIVVDNEPGTRNGDASAGAGDGIRGMRERAEALGGELEAGPRPDGGFRVRARLPINGRPDR